MSRFTSVIIALSLCTALSASACDLEVERGTGHSQSALMAEPPSTLDLPCGACQDPGEGTVWGCYDVDMLDTCAAEAVPRGVYALVSWKADARIEDSIFDLPHVSGVTVRSYWKDLEPSAGVYDWDKLDDHFAAASARGKGVRLAIAGGVYAPSWLIGSRPDGEDTCDESGPGEDSELGVRTFCADVPNGEFSGEVRTFPVPWDGVMHARWSMFLDALVAHLEGQNITDEQTMLGLLHWIAVTGPNGHNGEVSHPNAAWLSLGLEGPTPGQWITTEEELLRALSFAWRRAIDDFDARFGSRQIHYTVSWVRRSFPLGNGNEASDQKFKDHLMAYGRSTPHAAYFGVQTNGLDNRASWARTPDVDWPQQKDHWRLVRSHDGATEPFTGMQTRGMVRLYDENNNQRLDKSEGTPCKRGAVWRTILTNVKCLQVDVVEVYASDLAVPWTASCNGGVRGRLEALHAWLTDK
jgi:hypothetical protein